MAKYRIEHDRPNCIGCSACALSSPEQWQMDGDGKSNCVGARKKGDGTEEKELEEKDLQANELAAKVCPVNVIHIIDMKTGKKLI